MGRFIRLNETNKVESSRIGPSIINGEIESDVGEIGQIMQGDGTFIDDPTPVPATPTLEDKVNFLYYRGKGLI